MTLCLQGNDDQCKEFLEKMNKEFEMYMFGEIKSFVSLQIQQRKNGIYITQSKYIKEILKKFGMKDSKPIGTLMCTGLKLTKDDSKEVDQIYIYINDWNITVCSSYKA